MGIRKKIPEIRTKGKGTYEITDLIVEGLKESGFSDGLVSIFVQHTSCSLVIMENADPTARVDLERFMEELVPEDYPYFIHTHEGPDDMPSHVKMALTRRVNRYLSPKEDCNLVLGRAFFCGNIVHLLTIDAS